MAHAIEGNEKRQEPYRRTRHAAFCVLVIADAASIYKHGPQLGHALVIVTASGLLYPSRLLDFARLALGRRSDRDDDPKE